jgi:tRNA threonylcarbamoyladenosine biosynthesis protein TsaB
VRLLAVDTTAETGSIALVDEQSVIEEVTLHSPDGFAHMLFPAIEQLLARHGLTFASLDGFASASGPGSFTGVRVGLTAVKGLAEATGRKVVAVSNLQALASFGTHPLRAVNIDARRGEIYGAVYDAELNPVRAEVVVPLPDWLATLPALGDVEIIIQQGYGWNVTFAPLAIAGAIGRIACGKFLRGEAQDPAEIDANYVRRSDAELFWKEA